MDEVNLMERITAIEDKIAIKELIDNFSRVSDQKNNVAQALFFTENGILTSIMGEETIIFKGRKEIKDGFASILASLETVYHHNGQSQIILNSNKATGFSYCLATLISKDDDCTKIRTIAANYKDQFVKENNTWFIEKRTATVAWEETKEI